MNSKEIEQSLGRIETKLSDMESALRGVLGEQLKLGKYTLALQLSIGLRDQNDAKQRIAALKQIVAELDAA